LLAFPLAAHAAEQEKFSSPDLPVEVVADQLEYFKAEKKIVGKGNVVVTYKKIRMSADAAEVYTDAKIANAQGHVTIVEDGETVGGEVSPGQTIRGVAAEYDLENRKGTFEEATAFTFPWYGSSEHLEQLSPDEIYGHTGSATTCDLEHPHYEVKAESIKIYAKDKIILKNLTIEVLGKKVLWLPYLNIPLDIEEPPLEIQTGYSDNFGYFLYLAKGASLTKNVKVKLHGDFRSKRGVGGGADLLYWVPKFGRGKLVTYVTGDKRAPRREFNQIDSEEEISRDDATRYRVSLRHRTDFGEDTYMFVGWHELSDEFLLQEFYSREDRKESRPRTQIVLTHVDDKYSVFTEVVKRTNKFFDEVEKLPRLSFSWKNQPLFDTNLMYKNKSEYTNFNRRFASQALEEDTMRFDTRHEVQYPFRLFDNRVKVTPYANVAGALYTKKKDRGENASRFLMGTGFEARTRYQKTYDVQSDRFGIKVNQLRHIAEPILRYDATRLDTLEPENIYDMDTFDKRRKHDVIQLAFDNRFQTKRMDPKKGEVRVDILSYTTFINYEFGAGRRGGSGVTEWGHQASVRPYNWLRVEAKSIYNFARTDVTETSLDVILEPQDSDRFRLVASQGYLKKDISIPGSETSNLLTIDLLVKINERWKVGSFIRTELKEKQVEEWELRFIRDLHDFILAFGINVRSSSFSGGNSKEAFVEFRMKHFPGFGIGTGNRASLTRPRVGAFYDGANQEESFPSQYYGAF